MAKKPSSGSRSRMVHERVKTARGRKISSTRWLQRQLNDPYVAKAKAEGYRSRAAFKLLEIQEKFNILKSGMRVLDLGAAPGGWSQIAAKIIKPASHGCVVAVDCLEMAPMEDVTVLQLDFLSDEAEKIIIDAMDGRADVLLSDMAPSFTGHPATDHLRTVTLVDACLMLAEKLLVEGGCLVAKMIKGTDEARLMKELRAQFESVKTVKPSSSRQDSAEHFIVCQGFRKTPKA